MLDITPVVARILEGRASVPADRSMLVAVSGIDASGKGYTTRLIVDDLRGKGIHAVSVNVDLWYNLPQIRFSQTQPGKQFYLHGLRFQEMFDRLILPLKQSRSIELDANLLEETAQDFHMYRYDFKDVDVIVLEGIFLFQAAFRSYYDLAVWVECSFETAIERAVLRGQEGLPPAETVEAFESIYFPAERIHFEIDNPKGSADMVIVNDPRLVRFTG